MTCPFLYIITYCSYSHTPLPLYFLVPIRLVCVAHMWRWAQSGVFLHGSTLYFWDWICHWIWGSQLARLVSEPWVCSSLRLPRRLGLQARDTSYPAFFFHYYYEGSGDPTSGPQACGSSTLLTEPSPKHHPAFMDSLDSAWDNIQSVVLPTIILSSFLLSSG